jgi:hypothetical protein
MLPFRNALIALALFVVPALRAQQPVPPIPPDTVTRQIVHTRDGSTVFGHVIAEDSTSIRIETTGGVLSISRADILSLTNVKAGDMHDGEYWFPDPNRTRLFFGPTGRMLDKGEGYYMNTYLLLQNFVGGLTDHVTIGGGFSLIPGVDPTEWLYYLTPKVSLYRQPSFNVAVGAFAGVLPKVRGGDFGVLYGVVTKGGPDASVTAGTGFGYAGSNIASRPVFMLGGEARVSRRVALLTENYLYVENNRITECTINSCSDVAHYNTSGVVSYGLRFLGEKLSVDFAFFNVASHDTDWIFPGIPYISFGAKF